MQQNNDPVQEAVERLTREIAKAEKENVRGEDHLYRNAFGDGISIATRTLHKHLPALLREAQYPLARALVQTLEWYEDKVHINHACNQCIPGGNLVKEGFVCAYHMAKDILATPPTEPAGGEG